MLIDTNAPIYSNFRMHYMAYTLEMNLSFLTLIIGLIFFLRGFFVKKSKPFFVECGIVLIFISILALIYFTTSYPIIRGDISLPL